MSALPDGSNLQVYKNQGVTALAVAALGTSSGVTGVGNAGARTNVQRIARALAAMPAHRQGVRNRSRRILWD